MPRRRPIELSISHERWLVSYADFITLLFAFFVVMYSISQVNESKYRVLSNTLLDAFHVPEKSINPIPVGSLSKGQETSVVDNPEPKKGELMGDGAFEKTADLPQLSDMFQDQFADFIDDRLIQVNSNEFWLQIDLKASILFASGTATPSLQARAIFHEMADLLREFNNPIQVEGFTDNVPIRSRFYPSNWELSSARAAAIVRLLALDGVAPERLSAVGYGEFQPLADNGTEAGRLQNRRVSLMISRERVQRPVVEASNKIAPIISPSERQETQPYPQPYQTPSAFAEQEAAKARQAREDAALLQRRLSGEERQQQLSAPLEAVGEVTETRLDDVLRPGAEVEPQTVPVDAEGVEAVELDSGGLLFTSDPDLPRNPQ